MERTVGTCSLCGGRVTMPESWMSVIPPIPTCQTCGARQAQPHGPVVEMEKPEAPPSRRPGEPAIDALRAFLRDGDDTNLQRRRRLRGLGWIEYSHRSWSLSGEGARIAAAEIREVAP